MSLSYRKDIDGMRAVAVLLVIFSHAHFSTLQGGFIGVDVFFVISGFLITSILKKTIENKSFSLLDFYLRRIRRIVPALLFLILGVSIASCFILLPDDMYLFAQSAVAGLTAWANIFFSNISGGYWGHDVAIMPLTHLWSLAIEEQFYFLWPTMMCFSLKYMPEKDFKILIAGLLLLLFGYSIHSSDTPTAYYQFSARAFEILLGCTIALWHSDLLKLLRNIPSLLLSLAGIILIGSSAILLSENVPFPGWNALWPCLGTALLLLSGQRTSIVTKVLESSPMTFIGKISYSLYLWHWPILAFMSYSGISISQWRWIAIMTSFVLASISFYVVEQPFRKKRWTTRSTFIRLIITPVCLILVFSQLNRFSDGMNFRFSGEKRQLLAQTFSYTAKKFPGCLQSKITGSQLPQLDNPLCTWGNKNTSGKNNIDLLLVGDSHASALRGFVEKISTDAGLSGIEISQSATPFLPETNFYTADGKRIKTAKKYSSLVMEYITQSNAQFIAIAARYPYYLYGKNEEEKAMGMSKAEDSFAGISATLNEQIYAEQLEKLVGKLVEIGKTPILFKGVPEMGRDVSRESIRSTLYDLDLGFISTDEVAIRQKFMDSTIDSIAKRHPRTIVIDPKDILCKKERCNSVIDNVPVYVDDDHLNYNGSKLLGRKYLTKYGNPLLHPKL